MTKSVDGDIHWLMIQLKAARVIAGETAKIYVVENKAEIYVETLKGRVGKVTKVVAPNNPFVDQGEIWIDFYAGE